MRNTSSSIDYELIYISFNAVKWGHTVRDPQTRDKKPGGLPTVKLEPDAKDILEREAKKKTREIYWQNHIKHIPISQGTSAVKT